MKRLALALSVLAISACATNPDKIEATYVSPTVYKNHTCDELLDDMESIERLVESQYGKMKKRRNRDTASLTATMVLFWPAVFFMQGKNSAQEARYSSLKGRYQALETAYLKRC
jgi:hypothetical protein